MSADAPNVPWVRLNAATFQDARLIRAGFWGGLVWVAALTMAKLHGWRGGRVPKDEFDVSLISHHLNAVTVAGVTQSIEEGIASLVRVGLLEDDGTYWQIRGWAKYQPDKTGAERQGRHRAKNAEKARVTVRNGSNADETRRDETKTSSPNGRDGILAEPKYGRGAAVVAMLKRLP